ncbi:hypothetical protein MOTE_24890 [Moorella thermoacetica]|uniref:Uncharacterized protein n=1 Tax=Neomoorella thermoacetica TaxID=1525 RepID=A0A1J5NCY0_NEOTH|nr:hypothetical protein MOTE_24890 [Moorella thermoacetica]
MAWWQYLLHFFNAKLCIFHLPKPTGSTTQIDATSSRPGGVVKPRLLANDWVSVVFNRVFDNYVYSILLCSSRKNYPT